MEQFTISFEKVSGDITADVMAAMIEEFLVEQFMDDLDPAIVDLRIQYV